MKLSFFRAKIHYEAFFIYLILFYNAVWIQELVSWSKVNTYVVHQSNLRTTLEGYYDICLDIAVVILQVCKFDDAKFPFIKCYRSLANLCHKSWFAYIVKPKFGIVYWPVRCDKTICSTDLLMSTYTMSRYLQLMLSAWPDLAIFCTLGDFLKPLATINLLKSPTALGNFCKVVKIYHYSREIIFGQLL